MLKRVCQNIRLKLTPAPQIIAYDKKKLVSDSRLGEARAPLNQLPRGRTARLNLVDHKTFGNIAGHVDFTLSGGGAGGEGAGNDSATFKTWPENRGLVQLLRETLGAQPFMSTAVSAD